MSSSLTTSENSASYFENTLSLTFHKMDTAKRIEMMALLGQDVVVLAKDNNGKIWLLGKDEPAQVSEATANTGNVKSDANSYTVTLKEESKDLPFEVTTETLNDLLTDWATEYLTFEIMDDGTDIRFITVEDHMHPQIEISLAGTNEWHVMTAEDPSDDIGMAGTLNIGRPLRKGEKIYLRGISDPFSEGPFVEACFCPEGPICVYGSLGSLVDKDDFREFAEGDYAMEVACLFTHMFDGTYLNDGENFYSHPTKQLVFPFVEVTTSAYYALYGMFYGCSNMVYAPRIDVTSWDVPASDRFGFMFYGCSSLKYIHVDFPLKQGANVITPDWVNGVASNGIFGTSVQSNFSVPRGVNAVPANWKMVKI